MTSPPCPPDPPGLADLVDPDPEPGDLDEEPVRRPLTSPWGVWSGPGTADVPRSDGGWDLLERLDSRRAGPGRVAGSAGVTAGSDPARHRGQVARGPGWRRLRWQVPRAATVGTLLVVAALAALLVLRLGRAAADPVVPLAAAPSRSTGPGPTAAHQLSASAGATTSPAPLLVVDVVGRVRRPGVVRLPPGARVEQALRAAGGALSGADLARVNLARPVVDGEQIAVPAVGQPLVAAPGPAGATAGTTGGATAVVDLNAADEAALDALPGIGPVLAQRIVQWRAEHGRFSTVDELGEVSGIGESLLARLRPLVRV